MKILLDTCVWGGTRAVLAAAAPEVFWAGDWVPDPGDEEILRRAHAEGRVLVTLDKDFGELAVARGTAHSGILRLVGLGAREQGAACLKILASHGAILCSGAILTAERGRLRI